MPLIFSHHHTCFIKACPSRNKARAVHDMQKGSMIPTARRGSSVRVAPRETPVARPLCSHVMTGISSATGNSHQIRWNDPVCGAFTWKCVCKKGTTNETADLSAWPDNSGCMCDCRRGWARHAKRRPNNQSGSAASTNRKVKEADLRSPPSPATGRGAPRVRRVHSHSRDGL